MNNPQDQWWMPGGGLYSDVPTFPYDRGSDYQTEQNLPDPPDWEALQESLFNLLPHNLRNMDDQNITPKQFSPQELPDMLYRDSGPMEPQLAQGGPEGGSWRVRDRIPPQLSQYVRDMGQNPPNLTFMGPVPTDKEAYMSLFSKNLNDMERHRQWRMGGNAFRNFIR